MYELKGLQAVEPMELLRHLPENVGLTVRPGLDVQGFHTVDVVADTREALVAYVKEQWGGEDDIDWLNETLQQIRSTEPPFPYAVHVNVEADHHRPAEDIEALFKGALEVGTEGYAAFDTLRWTITLTEEI